MIRGGQGGPNRTELISSPKLSDPGRPLLGDRTGPHPLGASVPSPTGSQSSKTQANTRFQAFSLGDGSEKARPARVSGQSPTSGPVSAPADRVGGRNPPLGGSSVPQGSALAVGGSEADADAFEERAAIREFDGGLSRAAAERLAALDIITSRAAGPATFNPLA